MATSTRRRKADGPFDPVTTWARDVVDGKIIAGEITRHAAERHLRDLRDGPGRGLYWDLAAAQHVIGWYPTMLTITAGAKAGEPFNLLPPHMFATGNLFGWKRADGRRRFRTFWFETGKGQAKSPWMAATGLYMMRFCGIPRFEGYAVAGNENQSGIVLGEAAAMCRANVPGEEQTLEEFADYQLRGTGDLTWQIEWNGSDAGLGICKLRNISNGSSISGPKPSLVVGDEVHEWDDPSILEMWSAALAKQSGDPLMLLGTNTPAADQIIGVEQSDYYTSVAKGEFKDDTSLALICTCDPGDDPFKDEAVWQKSLPALDITYPAANVRDEIEKSRGLPGKETTLKRLFFGLRVGVADCWIDLPLWESVLGTLDDEELSSLPCWLGLDLSSRKDLTALAAVWIRTDGHLLVRIYYWTPGATLLERQKKDKAPYEQWVSEGHLIATPGPTIPKAWPAVETKRLVNTYNVIGMAYDPAQIIDFEEACAETGLDIWLYDGPDKPVGNGLMMVRHGQGWKGMDNPALLNMPTGVKQLEDAILNGKITIEVNPVTNFCSGNMALAPGANPDQRVPNRRKARGRIDGMVAMIEAVNGARVILRKNGPSVYEERGIRMI
jgi:phage terminase large subunit-like protein